MRSHVTDMDRIGFHDPGFSQFVFLTHLKNDTQNLHEYKDKAAQHRSGQSPIENLVNFMV